VVARAKDVSRFYRESIADERLFASRLNRAW
jgi:hypothetical protein